MQRGIRFDGRPVWAEIRLSALAHNMKVTSLDLLATAAVLLFETARTGQIWQGRVYSRPQGRDFPVVSFFEGDTDGFETN